MGVSINWIEPNQIVNVTFSGDVDIADIQEASKTCLQYLRKGPVHFLMDFTATNHIAHGVLLHPIFSNWIHHPNARWFAYVNLGRMYHALVQVRHRDSMRSFYDKIQAEAFLRRSLAFLPTRD